MVVVVVVAVLLQSFDSRGNLLQLVVVAAVAVVFPTSDPKEIAFQLVVAVVVVVVVLDQLSPTIYSTYLLWQH